MANLLLHVRLRAEVAARRQEAEVLFVGAVLFEQRIGQREQLLEPAVPCHQARTPVEQGDAVAHVLERDA